MDLPISVDQILSSELSRSEKLLWCGRPRQGVYLGPRDAAFIPFSLLWGGFAILWEVNAVTSNAPFFFDLWGIPFVLIGLYLIAGRFFVDAKRRSRTYYGVTNERVIIVSGIFSRTVKSLQLRTLSDVSLSEGNNGMGTITFGPTTAQWWVGAGGWPGSPTKNLPPSFESICDARSAFDQIRGAQKAA